MPTVRRSPISCVCCLSGPIPFVSAHGRRSRRDTSGGNGGTHADRSSSSSVGGSEVVVVVMIQTVICGSTSGSVGGSGGNCDNHFGRCSVVVVLRDAMMVTVLLEVQVVVWVGGSSDSHCGGRGDSGGGRWW